MIDAVKDFLFPKTFGIVGYVCVIIHFLCGLVFIGFTVDLKKSENGRFSCFVDAKSTATYKKQIDQSCFARYDQTYNSPLPLYGFVLLSIGLPVVVSVIYSLIVRVRVHEIESSNKRQNGDEDENLVQGQNRKTVYVIYFYFVHLVVRLLFGIILTVLQYAVFYADGFDFKFKCNLLQPITNQVKTNINTRMNASHNLNDTSVDCENPTAWEKRSWSVGMSVVNIFVVIFILVEVICVLQRLPILNRHPEVGCNCDIKFVTTYFFRMRNVAVHFHLTAFECIDIYKEQVLNRPLAPDINYLQNTPLDDMYIDVVIHTKRAERPFSEEIVDRHEIYDVYTEIPSKSILLESIGDLFHPNKDIEGNPRSILVIGRPGIGKTVLTEKIISDWAKENDDYYRNKIALVFKFRWLNSDELKNICLKKFLRFGTKNLSEKYFDQIYEETINDPQKAILIFDGLDEFHRDPTDCIEQSQNIPDDQNEMSAMNLCMKLIFGDLLKGATVLVTSRPTTDDFYSALPFERKVEIIGFTPDKIEEYVKRFCENTRIKRSVNLAPQISRHIKSSSELSNLCYIPVNCFIVCDTLSRCLSDSRSTLPTTLTELYQRAAEHFGKYHHGNSKTEKALSKLQELAFLGMENKKLIFDQELLDEQMKKSGFLNSLPSFAHRKQFCFIHLTIQEFLSAKHVTEALGSTELKKFISDHVGHSRWQLVLQFIAGLVGKKISILMKMEYKECLLAFAESIEVVDGGIDVSRLTHNAFVIKCLKEVDDEDIAADVMKTTEISGDVNLLLNHRMSRDECAEIAFSAKILKNSVNLVGLNLKADVFEEMLELLRKRCIKGLRLRNLAPEILDRLFNALANAECALNHSHSKLTTLEISYMQTETDPDLSSMIDFLKKEPAKQLEVLILKCNNLLQLKNLCEVFNDGHCTNLAQLSISYNIDLNDDEIQALWGTLMKRPRKLTKLDVSKCNINGAYILSRTLQDIRCQLTDLDLSMTAVRAGENDFSNFRDLGNKLTKLGLGYCRLTPNSIYNLCYALKDEHCQLTDLTLSGNAIGNSGVWWLCKHGLMTEHCKLTKLRLDSCSLTDQCIPSLCKALQDVHCKLRDVSLSGNNLGNDGVCMLFEDGITKEHCKLTKLNLNCCSLTEQCIPSLCKALQDVHCKLTDLDLSENAICNDGVCMLFENALTNEHCELTNLSLEKCSLTNQCVPRLCEALQDEGCRIVKLRLHRNKFTGKNREMLRNIQYCDTCKGRGLHLYLLAVASEHF